jgi:PAS domain S-box-containing protein
MDAERAGAGADTQLAGGGVDLGLAFERAAIGMALIGRDGRLLQVNQTLCQALGRQRSELVGAAVAELAGFGELDGVWERLWLGAEPFQTERRFPRPDGDLVDLRLKVELLCGDHGPVGLLCQAQDVTERNAVARALQTRVAWLRSVVANAPIVLSVYDRNGDCTFSEGRAYERVGMSPQERVGRSYAELRGDVDQARADFQRLLAGEEVSAKRLVSSRHPHGEAVFDVHYRPLPAVDGGDEVAGVISVAVDVTALERVERERRSLLHQLITAQEIEQRRLAANLHDDAVQTLTAARMQLSVLEAQLDRQDRGGVAGEVRSLVKQVRENLEQGLQAARTFLFDLRPPLLDQAGLRPALGQQLDRLAQRSGCRTRLRWEVAERLDQDLEVLVFRVVQETLANVAKHARAASVRVRGWREGSSLEVEVADDGVGFDQRAARRQAVATGHIGLRCMAERVEAAGGELHIATARGHGTRVRISLPVPAWS